MIDSRRWPITRKLEPLSILRHRRKAIPEPDCRVRGAKFAIQIDRDSVNRSGTIWNEGNVIRWRYRPRKNPLGRSLGNPFNKPDFVVAEEGREYKEILIRRASFVPSVFSIIERNEIVGRIKRLPVLGVKYSIEIDGEGCWILHILLFSIRFYAESSAGPDVWGVLGRSKMEWLILMKPHLKQDRLLPALAFIHNERWNYPS